MNEAASNCREIAQVDLRKCNACGTCLEECPFGAIQIAFNADIGDGRATVDSVKCNGCGSCIPACARKAISLVKHG